jgi:hypothetical protein
MLKDQNTRPLFFGKLNNASAHQMGEILIGIPDLAPEGGIILLPLFNDAS